jgi:hypothetical protein
VTFLFERHTWSDLHAWGGVLMIAAIAVHFAIHWEWVKRMSRRMVSALSAREEGLSRGAKLNVALNALVGVSFLACAVSGIYFLFAPSGGFQGGLNAGWDPGLLFSRTTWDLIHTWSGVVLSATAAVHFAIHWRWARNVSVRFFLSLWPRHKTSPKSGVGRVAPASSRQA